MLQSMKKIIKNIMQKIYESNMMTPTGMVPVNL